MSVCPKQTSHTASLLMFTISYPSMPEAPHFTEEETCDQRIAMTHLRTTRCIVTMAPEPSPAVVRYDPIDRGRQAL